MINVQVEKNQNESSINLIKRFTRRVQGSGVLPRVRSIRYKLRNQSEYVKKKRTLKSLLTKKQVEEMVKMGKMPEKLKR
jgi:hypothetical protein